MAGHIVEKKQSLSIALGLTFKDINCIVDLHEKVIGIKEPVMILASFEYNLSIPDGC
jgi:hypothetical protein